MSKVCCHFFFFLEGVQCSGNTSLETSQDSALQIMWDTLDFSWGYPADGANTDIGDDDVDDGPTGEGTQLALEDGSVHDDDDDESEVDTTQPEQTSDEIDGLDAEPLADGNDSYPTIATKSPVQYTQEELDQQDSQLEEGFKLNEIEPSVPVEVPGSEASVMPPPAPPSPGTVKRKRAVMERLEQIRFGLMKFPGFSVY